MQVLGTIRAYLPHRLAKGALNPEPGIRRELTDVAPVGPIITAYDEEHIDTYLRVLNAAQDGADWREISRIVLHVDPDQDRERARLVFDSHLARAKWMTHQLLRVDQQDR
jgi:hypothetical protein